MRESVFLFLYFMVVIIAAIFEIRILTNDKSTWVKRTCKGLENLLKNTDNSLESLTVEIEDFYNRYCQENVRCKKFFSDVTEWLDSVIYRIDFQYRYTAGLKDSCDQLKKVRKELKNSYPFNRCNKEQQNILNDINKVCNKENEIIIHNVINRTQEEFLRLNKENSYNKFLSAASVVIGIMGIVISILV